MINSERGRRRRGLSAELKEIENSCQDSGFGGNVSEDQC